MPFLALISSHFFVSVRRCDGVGPARKCQVIRFLRARCSCWEGSGEGERNSSKCKSNLMNSPPGKLIRFTYERASALYNSRMEVALMSLTDWWSFPAWKTQCYLWTVLWLFFFFYKVVVMFTHTRRDLIIKSFRMVGVMMQHLEWCYIVTHRANMKTGIWGQIQYSLEHGWNSRIWGNGLMVIFGCY